MSDTHLTTEDVASVLASMRGDIEERVAKGGIDYIGLPTGFFKLDEATLGLRKNAYYIAAARSSVGKTAFATSVMRNVAAAGHRVLYVTLEMSSQLLLYRLLSSISLVPAMNIERGRLTPEEHRKVIQAQEQLAELPISFYDKSVTTNTLKQVIQESQQRNPNDLIVIDYITLIQSVQGNSRYEQVTHLSEFMRLMARDFDLPFLVLAQLNRESERREDKTPVLSDLRDSGSLEQDAHAVMLLHRPHYYDKLYNGAEAKNEEDDALIILAKNRQGNTGRLRANFIADRMEWIDPTNVQRRPQSLADFR